jgi:isochorismate synthase
MDAIISEVNSLEEFHQLALNERLPFVTYKLPKEKDVITLVQTQSEPSTFSNLSELDGKSGFVFAPFNNSSNYPIWLIQPDLTLDGCSFTLTQSQLFRKSNLADSIQVKPQSPQYEVTHKEYINQVNVLKDDMTSGKLNKLVLSRISIEEFPENFCPTTFFLELKENYPNAFVFMLHIHKIGLWFGASPEPLLQIKNGWANTVSLAGTRVYNANNKFSDWGEKELEEQDIVTKYIESLLKSFGVENFTTEGPLSQQAGAIEHLLTRFDFDLGQLKGRIVDFLNSIHPTPSVCGIPKELALNAIKSVEKHNREYYTGFLGPFNVNSNYNLFVNLRSLKVEGNSLVYYIGAGITAGSNAQMEWEETNSKKDILKKIVEKLKTI